VNLAIRFGELGSEFGQFLIDSKEHTGFFVVVVPKNLLSLVISASSFSNPSAGGAA
jgi:hypothetical protein